MTMPLQNPGGMDTNPAYDSIEITPTDGANFTFGFARALYIGTTGNVNLVTLGGRTVLYKNVPVGILPVACKLVKATLTTASDIVALW